MRKLFEMVRKNEIAPLCAAQWAKIMKLRGMMIFIQCDFCSFSFSSKPLPFGNEEYLSYDLSFIIHFHSLFPLFLYLSPGSGCSNDSQRDYGAG